MITLTSVLKNATRAHWGDAFTLLLYTVLGGLLPVWVGMIVAGLFSDSARLIDFASHGEFAVYSAATIAPVIYLMVHERQVVPFPRRAVFVLVTITCLVLSVAFFGIIAAVTGEMVSAQQVNVEFLATTTFVLFVFCVLLYFLSTVIDQARTTPPVRQLHQKHIHDLNKEFDALGGMDDQ